MEGNRSDRRTGEYAANPIKTQAPSTSSEDGRKERTRLAAESEDDRSPGQLDRDHHSGAGAGEAESHRGLRMGDVGVGSLPSEGGEESGGHSHLHNKGRGGEELETVHGSAPGDCSHEEESDGRIRPWWQGRGDEAGSETGRGHAWVGPQSFGSGIS